MRRNLTHKAGFGALRVLRPDAPRRVRDSVIDFSSLTWPTDVRLVLAEAFWSHFGAQSVISVLSRWQGVRIFDRFARETRLISGTADLNGVLLVRYIEWLNAQITAGGKSWSKQSRASAYATFRTLLQWIERCRPGVLANIEYPYNPFPHRSREVSRRSKLGPGELRAILRACEDDIARLRAARQLAHESLVNDSSTTGTLGWLLEQIEQHHNGLVPTCRVLSGRNGYSLCRALQQHGGADRVGSYLYPTAPSLLPYFLAILIHTAGNPEAIGALARDCLQAVPLLDDRQTLMWRKPRAGRMQRRTFTRSDPFEPPALVADLLEWNRRLLTLAPVALRERLFLYKNTFRIATYSPYTARRQIQRFCDRHNLRRFALSSVRPSVLTSFYRATGDLRRVSAVANHAHLSTTIRYVEAPEVSAQHLTRVAALQSAFIGHIQQTQAAEKRRPIADVREIPNGEVVSMFGFGCVDPMAGVAPGTHPGQMCTHFMGCFTCPNAIITAEPASLARLLQARDHLRAASATLHPARWEAFYAPQLRILEEDILPRFGGAELARADALRSALAPLPELR